MAFPYPQDPKDWQTAYTLNQAYQDSGMVAPEVGWVSLLATTMLSAYGLLAFATNEFSGFQLILFGLKVCVIIVLLVLIKSVAHRNAIDFFRKLYQPPEGISVDDIIDYRLYGRFKLPLFLSDLFPDVSQFKYIIAKEGQIEKKDEWPAWQACNVGGPILLIIFDGCALYLERGNRFSRIVGPGDKYPFLEWYETIKYAVDLRPKVKEDRFSVWTKDGINISVSVRIECRIGDPRKHDAGQTGLLYPYDPEAVKKAVERYALRWSNPQEEPSEFTWVDAAWGQVTGILPEYIGSRLLDDLLLAERKNGQILSPEAHAELLEKVNKRTNAFGVYVTDLQLVKIELPKEVEEQQKKTWEVEQEGLVTIIDGEAKAYNIRTMEKARADAQRDLLVAIADGLDLHSGDQMTEPLLVSLARILDKSLQEPIVRASLANETLDMLERILRSLKK